MDQNSFEKSVVSLYKELTELTESRDKILLEHNVVIGILNKKISHVVRIIGLSQQNLDTGKILCAESILAIHGLYIHAGNDRNSVIKDAIRWFIDGKICYENGEINYYKDLRRHYFGTKSYDRWYGQRTDCEYGYGPRHGYIMFSVGLKHEFRDHVFTPEEIEACVYYLNAIEPIQSAINLESCPIKEKSNG